MWHMDLLSSVAILGGGEKSVCSGCTCHNSIVARGGVQRRYSPKDPKKNMIPPPSAPPAHTAGVGVQSCPEPPVRLPTLCMV